MSLRYVLDSASELVTQLPSLVVSASSESSLVALNASELPVAKVWRSLDDTSEWLEFDLGSARSIDFVALANCNVTASPTTFQIKGGSTTAPSDFTQVLPTAVGQMVAARGSEERTAWRQPIDLVALLDGALAELPKLFAADRGKGHLRLEVCRVITAGSSRHFSLLFLSGTMMPRSGSDSTYPTVQFSGTTSLRR